MTRNANDVAPPPFNLPEPVEGLPASPFPPKRLVTRGVYRIVAHPIYFGAVLTAAQVNDVQGLVEWAGNAPPAQLATLAPVVMSVADAGDLRANSLVTLAVEELVLHVRALALALFVDERAAIPVAFTGGMLSKGTTLRKRLEHRMRSAVPGAQVQAAEVDPARGAVRGALRILGA